MKKSKRLGTLGLKFDRPATGSRVCREYNDEIEPGELNRGEEELEEMANCMANWLGGGFEYAGWYWEPNQASAEADSH